MRLKLFIYFLFLFFLLSFFASGVVDSQDGFLYLSVARSIYYKGDFTAPINEYDYEKNTGKNIILGTYIGRNGKTYSHTGIGYSVALLPAVFIADTVYKIYNISPAIHFPLESDWLILLLASFTNAFFGSILGVIMFLYLKELHLSVKQAFFISLATILGTNLWVYTKHSLAHMMFIVFLMLSFYLLKRYSRSSKLLYLMFSAISFGVLIITYNQTFMLAILPFTVYYLLLHNIKFNRYHFQKIVKDLFVFLVAVVPFILLYLIIENTRAEKITSLEINYANPLAVITLALKPFITLPIGVIFEGVWGQLLSPGRSIFLYSPILLIPIFFWHKIKVTVKAELVVFILLGILYVLFIATQYRVGLEKDGLFLVWHGESSWGPRYLTPLIPFGMLLVGGIFRQLSNWQRYVVFYPLLLVGIIVNFLGIIMPYQLKFHNLEKEFHINGQQYTNSSYINLLPRYTPIISMSKNLVKLIQDFPQTLAHGIYKVKFYDGIDFPFNVGPERWRVIEGKGYISFDNSLSSPVKELTFGLINHPLAEASESAALVNFYLNKEKLNQSATIIAKERSLISVPIKSSVLQEKGNNLIIDVQYDDPTVFPQKKQILGLISMTINNAPINLETLNFPFISDLGPAMGFKYQNYGNIISTPWKAWDIHTQIYERTPDFWWIKPLYYWDLPKNLFLGMFILNIASLIFFAAKTFNWIKRS